MADMKVGQLAGKEDRFCPFAAVNQWPYKHLYGKASEEVSKKYFAYGEFKNRGWTVYYIRTLLDNSPEPLLLTLKSEVHALFVEIFETLGVHADFPDVWSYPGFDIGFQEEGSPRPRYLGRLTNNCSLDELEEMIPKEGSALEEPQNVADWSFPAFRRKMEAAILAGKVKNKAAKEKKRRDRVVIKRGWCAGLKRTQCYLGIRPRGIANKEEFHADPNYTWEQSQATQAAYEQAAWTRLPKLIPTSAAPYCFHQNVVFVCVDIEAYEMDQTKITEIGISTLDTLDLTNVPPGEGGAEWMKKIRARHFRIAEHAHLQNRVHVAGCADNFLKRFGTSEWVSINNTPQAVASCFRHPFSAPGQYTPFPSKADMIGRYGFEKQLLNQYLPPVNDNQKRNVVLVGHEVKSDIEYLRTIGYDVTNLSNLLEAVDTIDLYKAMKHAPNTPSLGTILLELELTGWHLHNAGNDAGYTMEALIGLSFAALTFTHKPAPDPERSGATTAEAQARLIEEQEDWEIADEEGGDGGSAVPLASISEVKAQQSFAAGIRRTKKAEEKANQKYYNHKKRGTIRGYKGNHEEDFLPSLRSSVVERGEINYHAANEKKMREMALNPRAMEYTPPHLRGMSKNDSKAKQGSGKEMNLIDLNGDKNGGVPLPKASLSQQTKKRLAVLDDDHDYFTI